MLVGARLSAARDALYERLREHGIIARRYFYPLITDFPMYRGLPSAAAETCRWRAAAGQVLCLPIYPASTDADVHRIAALIRECRVSTPAALA